MFRETQNYANEKLNILKKRYNDNEVLWNRALQYNVPLIRPIGIIENEYFVYSKDQIT